MAFDSRATKVAVVANLVAENGNLALMCQLSSVGLALEKY